MTTLPTIELDFTSPPPIPAAGVERVNELLMSGRLFRYGETGASEIDVAELETAFARLVGRRYCITFNSCGAALAASLMAVGVGPGTPVLMNAFTLAPVPGAIVHAGGDPVFVGVTPDYEIDLQDLRAAAARSGSRFLMLSHMRGHITDMDRLMEMVADLNLTVIEDCAHTMGAGWGGRPSGTFGAVGCFSTQTFKHVNSGEGGLLVTDDEDVAARAILLSGSYMLYAQHGTAPPPEAIERHRYTTPNLSMRMSALAAAVARPQRGLALTTLPEDGIDIVVVLDVSGSMSQLAEPGRNAPSKLEAAQEVIGEFIESLEGDRIGLVAFQSRAILLSPLTLDHDALGRQVDAAESGLIPDGTAIGLGIAEALNLLRESPARSRIAVLLTDGENNQGEVPPMQAARIAETLGIRIYTIGLHGAARGGSQVDVRLLQQIAAVTDAGYFDAATQVELSEAYREVRRLERSRVGERRFTEFREYGPLLAVAALLLLAAEVGLRATVFRRYP